MNKQELQKCQTIAQRLWLSGWYLLNDEETCLRECNGCGADWMPKWIRTFLDFVLRLFAPAVAIHDMRYYKNDSVRESWDDEFLENCQRIAKDKYSWCNPLRYVALFAARRLYIALLIGGELAWREAGKRFTEVE